MPRSSKPRKPHNRCKTAHQRMQNRPHMLQIFRTFAPIHELLRDLRSGEIDTIQGRMIMRDWGGGLMEVGPAMDGWICCWERIIKGESLDIDIAPLRQLQRYLANGILLTPEMIDRADFVTDQCERAYGRMTRERAISYSRTEMIAIELDSLGITTTAAQPLTA
jgi:hypothetical protein